MDIAQGIFMEPQDGLPKDYYPFSKLFLDNGRDIPYNLMMTFH
jgi:hypothetical protein